MKTSILLLCTVVSALLPCGCLAATRYFSRSTGNTVFFGSSSPKITSAWAWKYPFDRMLGMSYYFFEAARAGRLPADTRVPWRGDSLMLPGGSNMDGVHEGGYFDGGDYVKFMLPQAYTIARLAWSHRQFRSVLNDTYFDGSQNANWAYQAIKWGADFLVKGLTNDGRYLLHIGNIDLDHSYIGRSEFYPQSNRNILYCRTGQCSDVTGEAAAALAHAALVFNLVNPRLSQAYWAAAIKVYGMTGAYTATSSRDFGPSSVLYPKLMGFYPSTGTVSHVFFGAASMWTVCKAFNCPNEATYLAHALRFGAWSEAYPNGQKWYWEVAGWDNAWWDGALLMLQGGQQGPKSLDPQHGIFDFFLGSFVNKWVSGVSPIKVGPYGQRWVMAWGSNRYSINGAYILLLWANLPASYQAGRITLEQARCTAVKQVHYVAGDNDHGSYVVGSGPNAPKRPHHRNSACSPSEQKQAGGECTTYFSDVRDPSGGCPKVSNQATGECYPQANRANPYTLHGGLVGGVKTPTAAGPVNKVAPANYGWNDWRSDWQGNEVAIDYNAGYTFALIGVISLPSSFWTTGCSGLQVLQPDKSRRCGLTWQSASTTCGSLCPDLQNSECPKGLYCWSNLPSSPCSTVPSAPAPPSRDDLNITSRFGVARPADPMPQDALSFSAFSQYFKRTLPPFMSTIPQVN